MVRRIFVMLILLVITGASLQAQQGEALELPADLYVLTNDGIVQRYGVGASGVLNLSPEGAYVLDMGVDDRGERLAYRTQDGLFVRSLTDLNAPPVQIEGATASIPPYRGRGKTIAFSPVNGAVPGTAIAYTTENAVRLYFEPALGGTPIFQTITEQGMYTDLSWSPGGRYLAAETDGGIWWIYRRDPGSVTLTSVVTSSVGTAWASDAEIIFAPTEGGLKIMNLDLANQQTDLLPTTFEYRLPVLDADDNLLVFGRAFDDANTPAGYGLLLRLARGATQLETLGRTPIELTGLRWVPGGTLMIAFQAGVLAVFDPASGYGFALPIENAVAYDWGPYIPPELRPVYVAPEVTGEASESPVDAPPVLTTPTPAPVGTAVGMPLPAAGFFLARDGFDVAQVWTLPRSGSPPEVLTYADFDVTDFTPSPDGSRVVYVSDGQLWLQEVDSFIPESLTTLRSLAPANASFSPDGTRIAYTDEGAGIGLITLGVENVAGFEIGRVLANTDPAPGTTDAAISYRVPQFAPDGTKLLVDVYININPDDPTAAQNAVGVFDLTTSQLFATNGVTLPDMRPLNTRWMIDGRILTHSDAFVSGVIAPGFYIYDYVGEGGVPSLAAALPENRLVRTYREISAGIVRALLANATDPAQPLDVMEFDLNTGASRIIGQIEPTIGSPRFSPDGRFIGGYRLEAGAIDSGALAIIEVVTGRITLINPVAGLAAQVWGFRFGDSVR